ncbi:MAG: hypothetical protein L0206_21575 [Actinobacteria bacterium]|nr:hypothetical protein [Actinomycetota bacterium]
MVPPLTETGAADTIRENPSERWMVLVEIKHPTIPASGLEYPDAGSGYAIDTRENTLRLVFNTEPVVANHGLGDRTYAPAVIEATWLDELPDRPPRAGIKIGFATALIKELRELTTPPELLVTMKRIIASAPNDIQGQVFEGVVRAIEYDSLNIEAELLPPEVLNAAQPRYLTTSSLFPALHGATLD